MQATGSVGEYYVEGLQRLGKHQVTAITREDSTAKMPSGVEVKRVNYNDQSSIVRALQEQEVLLITLGVNAPRDQHSKLVRAAAEAKVPWVIPNEHGPTGDNEEVGKDVMFGPAKAADRKEIEVLGVSSYIGFSCGFWFEYSLAGGPNRYGFDFKARSVTYIDEGNTPLNTSTWPQCGRAMAKLLSLKVLPDDAHDTAICLDQFRNKFVYVSSFYVSQKQMMESVLRVTGDKPEDWKVSHENHKERYEAGKKELQNGDLRGFGKLLYTRVFYPDGLASPQKNSGTHNELLGLPQEDLDECTKVAIRMAENSEIPY